MPIAASPSTLARAAGALTILLGLLVLAGWILEIPLLKSVMRGAVEMKANTAAGLVLSGAALFILAGQTSARLQGWATLMALFVSALGLGTLAQYLFGWQLGIDELLFRDGANAYNAIPGRMAPYSAFAFGALGMALVVLPRAACRPLVWLSSALVTVVGVTNLLGYAWNANELITDELVPPVAVHTALAFTLLGVGTLLASRDQHARSGKPPLTRASIEFKVLCGFFGAFLSLVVGGRITYQTSAEFARSAQWVVHTQEVRARLSRLYAAVSDAESEQRDYLLTGAPAQKDDYFHFSREAGRQAEALAGLIADNPSQQGLLARLNALVAQRLKALEQTIAVLDDKGFAAARAIVASEEGNRIMDALRKLVYEMDEAEAALLVERGAQAARHRQTSLAFLMLTLVGAAAVLTALLYSVRREMLARANAEEHVRNLNADLERRVAERTALLEENQQRFVDLFEFAPDAFVMTNCQGTIVQVNRQAEAIFGWERSALVGQSVEVLLPVELRAGHVGLRERFLQSSEPRVMEAGRTHLRGLRRDGTVFPVDISLSPLKAGKAMVVVAAVRDTTERERTNDALRASEALYRHTLDNMLEGCQIVGFDWRYRYINAAAVRQNRQPVEAFIGRTMMEAFPGIERTAVFAKIRLCMEERTVQYSENEFVFPDGFHGWFQVSVLPAPEGVTIFSVDITERKSSEEKILAINADLERRVAERTAELLQAREAADDANRAKSAFLATMSHEIRTPMNGVVGMLDVLAQSRVSEDQASALATIRTSAFSLLAIIDDILDFSKIEAGRLELERAPVALPELIESVCDTLLPVAMDKDVELSLFVAPQVPEQVWGDATRLRQVLYNLAGNAIKFSGGRADRRGSVSVRLELAREGPPRLVLRIADNGIGMTPETVARLFSTFTQAETSTTRRFGGTGLGLAICKRLVALMNGEIEVRSTPDVGSTFIVILPLEAAPGGGRRADPDLRDLDCILVGTDIHREDMRVHLEYAGARVFLVDDTYAAVQRAIGRERPVVIQSSRHDRASIDALHAAFAAAPATGHLLITRGRRREPRMVAAKVVTLDGNCLRRSALLRAVAVAAGRVAPDELREGRVEAMSAEQAKPPTVSEARAQGRLLLIAEDDAVNQMVILRQIEALGYAAEVADNGTEALQLWRTGHHALLLTDLHMPDMDGYTLAASIRREETERGQEGEGRIPILALTANAVRGEAIRAKAAGVDEYLTKPLQLRMLGAALMRWLPSGRQAGTPPASPTDDGLRTSCVLDVGALKALVGDEPEIVREFLTEYRDSARRLASQMRAAHAADDLHGIAAVAHKLKASSRSVGAQALGDLCAELENACRTGIRESVRQGMTRFNGSLLAVEAELNRILNA